MKVWWCEEHQSSVEDQDDPSICLLAAWVDRNWQTPCRMVEMQLVPIEEDPPKDPWDYDP